MAGLFERSLRGDTVAQAEIHENIRRIARAICARGGPADVDLDWEDVAQEASRLFFNVGIRQYRGVGTEESFLFGIVRTTVLQVVRGAARRRQREMVPGALRENVARLHEHRIDVQLILRRLDPECARLLERVFLQDVPYPILSDELGIQESAVRARVSRCLRKGREIAEGGPR
jgi:RNA polymerase sigma factor (sigma-70 family)